MSSSHNELHLEMPEWVSLELLRLDLPRDADSRMSIEVAVLHKLLGTRYIFRMSVGYHGNETPSENEYVLHVDAFTKKRFNQSTSSWVSTETQNREQNNDPPWEWCKDQGYPNAMHLAATYGLHVIAKSRSNIFVFAILALDVAKSRIEKLNAEPEALADYTEAVAHWTFTWNVLHGKFPSAEDMRESIELATDVKNEIIETLRSQAEKPDASTLN
jgi:hypothetical protein